MIEKISEIPRQSKIELEKYWTKVTLDFIGWVWDKEKWVSLTGSATKLTIEKSDWTKSVWLIDFGMFQWWDEEKIIKYNEILPFNLKEIDFVLLTHTHVDHIWKTLHFSKDDFMWTIWTTKINKEVLNIMLSDVVKLQPKNEITELEKAENELKNLKSINTSKLWHDAVDQINGMIEDLEEEINNLEEKSKNIKKPKKDFFETDDIQKVQNKINSINKREKVEVWNDIQLSFIKAGHLPWSAQAILKIKTENSKYINIWFSGDVWKIKNPAVWWIPDESTERLDLYVIESTYAWRSHPNIKKEVDDLIQIINDTYKI